MPRCSARRGDGIGSNSLGRRGRPHHDRQAAAGQRPAPAARRCRASGTRWACTAGPCRADCPFDVAGFTFSGLPGVVIGHNQHDRLGLHQPRTRTSPTSTWRRSPATTLPVRRRQRRRCATRDETIKVAGGAEPCRSPCAPPGTARCSPTSTTELRRRRRERAGRRPARPPRGDGYAVALRWTALTPGRTADALFELDRAHGLGPVPGRRAHFAVPAQNLVYADRAGNIGYQAPGRIPIRSRATTATTRRRAGLRRTTGPAYIPFDALPNVLNPADGFVVTANQAVIGRALPVPPHRRLGLRLPQPADRGPADARRRAGRRSRADMVRRSSSTPATRSRRVPRAVSGRRR